MPNITEGRLVQLLARHCSVEGHQVAVEYPETEKARQPRSSSNRPMDITRSV